MNKKFLFIVFMFLIVGTFSLVEARDFSIFNSSNVAQNYFVVNGSTGYVGIGLGSPSYALDVVGDGNFTGNLYSNGVLVGSGSFNSTAWNRSGTDVYLANIGDSVGIGTSSPNQKLDVQGNAIKKKVK